MSGFFSKLFGKGAIKPSQAPKGLKVLDARSKRSSGRREPPTPLDWSRALQIRLPPSPPTWEVDGRTEFHRDYSDPVAGPVIQASLASRHAKALKLAGALSPEQRRGYAGEVIAKAYTKLILQRIKAGQLAAAAKQCLEMFAQVPDHVGDVDRRRFNRIVTQMDKEGKKHTFTRVAISSSPSRPLFATSDGAPWTLVDERKLLGEERPDTAFDIVSIDNHGIWFIDRASGSAARPEVRSRLRRTDPRGVLVGQKDLSHDVYRIGTAGPGIAIMDSGGVLHIYDTQLNAVTESDLRADSRVVDHYRTIETNYWGEFKSQVRAVDVDLSRDRYLFTLADEVWCCTTSRHAVWGRVMPLKDGWKRVTGQGERLGVSEDIENALQVLGLSLPVDAEDIKQHYRRLASANHPDRHGGHPSATEKMKALNHAFKILTGIDPATLDVEEASLTRFARTGPDSVMEVGGIRLEITMIGGVPQDWVYAARFAPHGGAYLATYSGKVILVSPEGQPEVVYDIGTCPSDIITAGRYTYFRTPTRLYVMEDNVNLVAHHDVFQQGQLLVMPTGFGLLAGKRLQWFTAAGTKIGELVARDPIRAVYMTDGGAVVQTRQHQIEVRGLVI